jgi:hypothetical protein
MSQDKPPDKEPASPDKVWEQLDESARIRVIEIFAHLAYQHAAARHEPATKEEDDVTPAHDAKDHA